VSLAIVAASLSCIVMRSCQSDNHCAYVLARHSSSFAVWECRVVFMSVSAVLRLIFFLELWDIYNLRSQNWCVVAFRHFYYGSQSQPDSQGSRRVLNAA